jgi:hypothetical protein
MLAAVQCVARAVVLGERIGGFLGIVAVNAGDGAGGSLGPVAVEEFARS